MHAFASVLQLPRPLHSFRPRQHDGERQLARSVFLPAGVNRDDPAEDGALAAGMATGWVAGGGAAPGEGAQAPASNPPAAAATSSRR